MPELSIIVPVFNETRTIQEVLVDRMSQNDVTVVYGSRFIDYQSKKNFIHYLGNRFLTGLTNLLFGAKLTDMETAYKMFRAEVVKNMILTS